MHTFRQGIHVREPDPTYSLHMQHEGGGLVATSNSFEALLEIRKQLARLSYTFIGLTIVEADNETAQ